MRRLAAVVALALLAVPAVAAAFPNTEPLAPKEWYLEQDHAWDYWDALPSLYPVKVGIVDSGVDGTNPDLVGRVVAARSFVGGSPYRDDEGHGTFVAGEIAANPTNALGIAGLAFNARLVVAKVVESDGSVPLSAEVAGIRWAVDQGAKVINLSLGGVRDPLDPTEDTYSPLEQAAIDYAYAKGAVVVAAVGNGPQSPSTPWPYAAYPAALPHVIGVSAIRQNGSVPDYSNRDAVYNDIAAPGDQMFSTIPTNLVSGTPVCQNQPWSDCGPDELRNAIGTSFAAPQVSAAAALILGQDPTLGPDQVSWLIERSATDATAATGCAVCPTGRDAYTGWGMLNVDAALTLLASGVGLPPKDAYEPNDDAGPWSHAIPPLPRTFAATLDYWDDDVDVYRVYLHTGQTLFARLTPKEAATIRVTLWAPGTRRVESLDATNVRLAQSHRAGGQARLAYRAKRTGTYYVEAKLFSQTREPAQYTLSLSRR